MVNMVIVTLENIEDVIQVEKEKLIEHVSEHDINQGLEDRGATGQTKGHYQNLMMPCRCVRLVFHSPTSGIRTRG